MHYIDVGQGDSILLVSETGAVVLIDGGPRSAGKTVVSYLKAHNIEELDLVIGTQPHEDHIGGLISVFDSFRVRRVIDSGVPHTTLTFGNYLSAIERQVEAGDCVYETPESQSVNLAANITLTILGTDRDLGSINNNSVVARVDFDQTSFLFTGDVEAEAEKRLLARGINLKADVLKVAHHGSSTSTSPAFLSAVAPVHAVISVGARNGYGHPTQQTLDRLAGIGAKVHRTDVGGTIVFSSNGISVSTTSDAWLAPAPDPGLSVDEGLYVGSKKSDKYHYPSCRSAKAISAQNEIWFNSAAEALEAGYSPCKTCNPPTK